ncbi:MAG UNVERIFIED_CONTAM: M48 family metalloprotease [Rickettsiaceae bacterium]
MKSILAISLLYFSFNTFAENIVRDSEIESVINDAISPIVRAAGMPEINIVLLENNEVNAFTFGNNEIIVHTGLIAKFPDIDVFKGVIAHEIGHILGHHVPRQMQNLENQKKIALASVALGIASAVASANPEAIAAGAIGGMDMAEKTLLKYSRTYESSADQAAFKLLKNLAIAQLDCKNCYNILWWKIGHMI